MSEDLLSYDGPTDFAHLHTHTVYSMLDGVQTPEQLVNACAERDWPAVAVTEHGHMASVPDCYFAAEKHGLKFIAGCEIYFNDYEPIRQEMVEKGEKIKDLRENDEILASRISRNRHLTVLAKTTKGFENLTELTSKANEFGFYYRPRIWLDKLLEYREGLIVLSGCLNGPISHELRHQNLKDDNGKGALDYVKKFKEAFGDDYFIELQMPCLANDGYDDHKIFWQLNQLANKFKIQKVLTNDAHYLNREDFETQKLMMAINQGMTIDSPDLFHVNSSEQFVKTRHQLWHTFKTGPYSKHVTDAEFEDMCDGTLIVADACDGFHPDTSPKVPTSEDHVSQLKMLVAKALKDKGLDKIDKKYVVDNREVTYVDQAKIELNRFIEKGFASYFIITRDLIKYSISKGWPVGPRGSVGGSLVCYLLGIHSIDPLKWGLSFDRFLSPSRGGYILNIEPE